MANARQPRQQKLRASCDNCGASKLKCDRRHPECERCVSAGVPCVYGLSRRVPKHQRTFSEALERPLRVQAEVGSDEMQIQDDDTPAILLGSSEEAGGADPFQRSHRASLQHDASMANPLGSAPTETQQQQQDHNYMWMYDPFSLELGDSWVFHPPSDPGSIAHFEDPAVRTRSLGFKSAAVHDNITSLRLVQPSQHDCFQQAYDALGSLSVHGTQGITQGSIHTTNGDSSGMTYPTTATHPLPIDEVLHRTRRANERLGEIASCRCAQSPDLQLLCATILARILRLYQHASGCAADPGWHPPSSPCNSGASSVLSSYSVTPSTGASSAGPPYSDNSDPIPRQSRQGSLAGQATGSSAGTSKITIGTFEVDDLGMQNILNIQLLSGELRKFGALVARYVSWSDSDDSNMHSELLLNNDHAAELHKNLSSWLTNEHTRITHMFRSRLRSL